jgi:hypothetical protein
LLGVFQPLVNFPAPIICLDKADGRQLQVVDYDPEYLTGSPFAREDDLEDTKVAHLQPSGIAITVADLGMGPHQRERRGAPSPKEISPISAGFQPPA